MKQYLPDSNLELSIVIVNYNTKDLLLQCLTSIVKTTGDLKNPPSEIIVVDNASTDSSLAAISNFQLIINKENRGFAKAVNQGIRLSRGDFIFVLNPDTVVKKDAIRNLLEFAKTTQDAGTVGPKLLNPDRTIQASVYNEPTILGAIQKYFLGKDDAYGKYAPSTKKPVKVEAVVGGAMLIPKSTIERIGLFDEKYFMYFEDLDYCRRAKGAGLLVYYLPDAQVIHEHGAAGRKIPHQTRKWLEESARLYHGTVKYLLLTVVLWLGQKWQKVLRL